VSLTFADKLTELFGAAVLEYLFVGRVESDTAHHVADLGAVDQAVSTVPEVEQIEHLLHVCATPHQPVVDLDSRTDTQTHFASARDNRVTLNFDV